MTDKNPEEKRGFKLDWYWGLLGCLGFLGLIPDRQVFYVFFVFFLFALGPVLRKNKK
jgi:hypothetical protein